MLVSLSSHPETVDEVSEIMSQKLTLLPYGKRQEIYVYNFEVNLVNFYDGIFVVIESFASYF